RQRTTDRGPAGPVDPSRSHPGHEWGKFPVPGEHEQEGRMILVPFGVANGQGRQPWPEEAWRVLRGASADLPRITLVPAGLRLLGPAGGWLYSQPHNDQGGPLFNGHRWSLIAFPFTVDKVKSLSEVFRVLKPGGRFLLADQVLAGELPKETKARLENWAR